MTGGHYPVGSKQSSSTGVTVGGAAQILQRDLGNPSECIKGALCKHWQPVEFILQINRGQRIIRVTTGVLLAVWTLNRVLLEICMSINRPTYLLATAYNHLKQYFFKEISTFRDVVK